MSFLGSLFGRDPEALVRRAESFMASGQWGAARLELDKALRGVPEEGDPRRAQVREKLREVTRRLALSHEEEGDHLDAEGLGEEAAQRYELALSLFEEEEDRRRVEEKLGREEAPPAPGVSRIFLDESYPQAGDSAGAAPLEGDPLEYFEVLMHTLDPEQAEEYRSLGEDFALGYVYTNCGDYGTAIAHYRSALDRRGGEGVVRKELGRALLFTGETEAAVRELAAAREVLSKDLELLHLLASAHAEAGRTEAAIRVLEEGGGAGAGDLETLLLLGDLRLKGGDRSGAEQAYREALEKDRTFPRTHSRLGAWALAGGDESLAMQHYEEAVDQGNDVEDMAVLADLYTRAGRDPEIPLGLWNRALYYDPSRRWFYLIRIGELYLRKGWGDKAREVLEEARSVIPEDRPELRSKVEGYLRGE